jgi:hypothetical protein
VALPFLDSGELGKSKSKAISCFKSPEKQLDRDPALKEAYHSQIEDYISRKWVEEMKFPSMNFHRPEK